jgi:hypothetical protein
MTDSTDNSPQGNDSGIRGRAIDAYDEARESVADAGQRATDGIDEAPLIALAGGLAVGVLLAALLPRSESEKRALRPVGDKLAGTAKAAATAAKEAGTSRLAELGITPEKGRETLRSLFEGAGEAAKTSAQAALSTAKNRE